ncbi:hypothetical protein [Azospirillum doebereinerae]
MLPLRRFPVRRSPDRRVDRLRSAASRHRPAGPRSFFASRVRRRAGAGDCASLWKIPTLARGPSSTAGPLAWKIPTFQPRIGAAFPAMRNFPTLSIL